MSASLTGETHASSTNAANASQFEEVRKTLRKFYEQEVKPRRDEMDKNPEVCRELIKKLGRLGMLTPTFPEQYGGFEATREFRGMMAGEASRVSPSLSLSAGAHSLLCANTVFFFGNDEQKNHYLPRLSSAEMIGCWGVTEPEAGSDVGSMRSTAVLQGDKYVLNGNKTFITNAPIADLAVVFAKTGKGPDTITGFILEKGQKGLTFGQAIGKFGMEGSPTGDIYMENVEVPLSRMLGKPGEGFKQIKRIFNYERMYMGASAIAIMERCLETSLKYAAQRKAFGEPIMNYQLVQQKIASMYSKISLIRSASKELYGMNDDEEDFHMKASSIKIWGSQWTVECCLDAMQILGGLGYTRECEIERFMRDAKLYQIGGGTSDIQHLIIFKSLAKSLL